MSRVSTLSVGALLAATLVTSAASAAPTGGLEPHAGTWLTADGLSKVRIAPCGTATPAGQTYCATIVWVRPPATPDDQDTYDKKKRFIGTNISSDLHHGEENLLVGSILNPESGKVYNAKVRLQNANALDMGGCVLGGLICGSERWSRASDELAAAPAKPPRAAGKPASTKTTGSTVPAAEE